MVAHQHDAQANQTPDLLLEKILLPGATLTAPRTLDEERLKKLAEASKDQQRIALRRKRVNEKLLRLVVNL